MSELQKTNRVGGSFMLLGSALIWGFAFVAQRQGAAFLNAFSFNGMRFLLAAATLFFILLGCEFIAKKRKIKTVGWSKTTVFGGMLCGVIVFFGNNLQQIGIESTSAGKAGFITSLYIVLVPIMGMLAGKRTGISGWFAAVLAVAGFWTISAADTLSVTFGDIMVLLCAFIFSFHILFIDFFAESCDPVKLTFIQFLTAAIISVPAMGAEGFPSVGAINACIVPILYVGILSAGVAFTLQSAGQKYTPPATATLLMSLEAVFALLGGVAILGETFTSKELIGCLIIFAAVLLAQLKPRKIFLSTENGGFTN